jgi:thioredoxin
MTTQSLQQLDGEADFAQVLESRVPAVVDFFADWCGPCGAVGPIIDSLSHEYAGKVSFAKLNVDDNEELASRYDVQSIPTVIIFRDGQVVDRVTGAASAQVYRAKINAVIANTQGRSA